MGKKKYRKHNNGTMGNRFEDMMQNFGTRELIIISSVIIVATLAIIGIMALAATSERDAVLKDLLKIVHSFSFLKTTQTTRTTV